MSRMSTQWICAVAVPRRKIWRFFTNQVLFAITLQAKSVLICSENSTSLICSPTDMSTCLPVMLPRVCEVSRIQIAGRKARTKLD
ncbi:hypothetical protein CEXT_701381 [Caerostris extrusa]|uniref:Secreted protein n=1 Tax=Caerostris extrusa TaxID=172846 RepID=A0AAV4VTX2_CAEEX|nr:hypothetical protein CEXT_701381 [Caerostris extrusa]